MFHLLEIFGELCDIFTIIKDDYFLDFKTQISNIYISPVSCFIQFKAYYHMNEPHRAKEDATEKPGLPEAPSSATAVVNQPAPASVSLEIAEKLNQAKEEVEEEEDEVKEEEVEDPSEVLSDGKGGGIK